MWDDSVAFVADVVIPSDFCDNPVTAIGNNVFDSRSTLRSITLPDTITSIGECAFRDCNNLQSIKLPDGLKTIGNYAFQRCGTLIKVDIPSSVESVGNSAFWVCKNLKRAYVWGRTTAIGTGAFKDSDDVTIYAYDSSPADTYASEHNISFIPLTSINNGDESESAQLIGTQSVEDDGNNFGLNQSEYNNFELLGVQIKSDAESKDLRFIAVVNEGIVSGATNQYW